LTINHIPDELLLEIFDFYRRGINSYDDLWKKKKVWVNLSHVCRRWRAVMFASSSRLELGITVGSKKPGHIKAILSGPLPILIDYKCRNENLTGSALWRLRAALGHSDRVREISFEGSDAWFGQFFTATTNCSFPVLESLSLCFGRGLRHGDDPKLPDTFLRGPDLSDLHPSLRRLSLKYVSLTSISGLLSSAKALTDLFLVIELGSNPSAQTSLLDCFQGIPCLRRLDLSTSIFIKALPKPSTPKDIVPFSKLTFFRYVGNIIFLDALVARLSAPPLLDVDIAFSGATSTISPIVHLPRFINDIEERYHAVHLVLQGRVFSLSLLTHSEYINHCKPRFKLCRSPGDLGYHIDMIDSLMRVSDALSTKLSTVEELRVTSFTDIWVGNIPWRRFLRQFSCVKALRIGGVKNSEIARLILRNYTEPDDHLPFLPALEEIELPKFEARETRSQFSKRTAELALFQPFVSARQQAGRPVKVFFGQ
jgi:hypothetical protein